MASVNGIAAQDPLTLLALSLGEGAPDAKTGLAAQDPMTLLALSLGVGHQAAKQGGSACATVNDYRILLVKRTFPLIPANRTVVYDEP